MTKSIKTRELLRNFKALKGQLVSGHFQSIIIDIGDEGELELSVKQPKKTIGNALRVLESLPKPRRLIRRTDLFETFLRNHG